MKTFPTTPTLLAAALAATGVSAHAASVDFLSDVSVSGSVAAEASASAAGRSHVATAAS